MPRLMITSLNYESAWRWGFCDCKMMFQRAFFTSWRSVPCFGNRFFTLWRSKQLIVGFQNDHPLCKMAAHCALGQIFALQAPENGCTMEDLRCILRYLAHRNALNRFSMHFNGLFYFAWRGFCSTAISLERIILVKRGTTVFYNLLSNRVLL